MKYILVIALAILSIAAENPDGIMYAKGRGGGSEIEKHFRARAYKVMKTFENTQIVSMGDVKVAFEAIKDIEAAENLTRPNGDLIKNESAHYAWYEDGKLQLKASWWKDRLINSNLEQDVLHELFRAAEDYYKDSKYNDDGYILSSKIVNELRSQTNLNKIECFSSMDNVYGLFNRTATVTKKCLGYDLIKKHSGPISMANERCQRSCIAAAAYVQAETCQAIKSLADIISNQYSSRCTR